MTSPSSPPPKFPKSKIISFQSGSKDLNPIFTSNQEEGNLPETESLLQIYFFFICIFWSTGRAAHSSQAFFLYGGFSLMSLHESLCKTVGTDCTFTSYI
jgi:hypothetical protein